MKKLIALLFLAILAFTGSLYFWTLSWWNTPQAEKQGEIEIEFDQGTSAREITQRLNKNEIIKYPFLFERMSRTTGLSQKFKAGLYKFDRSLSPQQIAEKIAKGEILMIQFVIPEGWNQYQIANKLAEVFPRFNTATWLSTMKNMVTQKRLPMPEAKSCEGFLFPDTYTIRPNAIPVEVLNMMFDNFKKNFPSFKEQTLRSHNLSSYQLLTLASIVEKETGAPEERPRIAAVFHNRLKKRMRLQTDPTIIYGIWDRYDGNIRKKDILNPTPYNTYMIEGLPPTPIANPGKAALDAVVNPAEADDLFFVSKNDGTHIFSKSLSEHNANVQKFQVQYFKSKQKK